MPIFEVRLQILFKYELTTTRLYFERIQHKTHPY